MEKDKMILAITCILACYVLPIYMLVNMNNEEPK